MMKSKHLLTNVLALSLGLGLVACKSIPNEQTKNSTEPKSTSSETQKSLTETAEESKTEGKTVTLRIAASATPHAEILEYAQALLDLRSDAKYKLDIKVFDDYVLPNQVTEEGSVDVNYFQHQPYMDDFNQKNGTHLVSVKKIHYEPFGLFAGRKKSLDELKEGDSIAIPNDGTNEGRALRLLESAGLIKLKATDDFNLTKLDIVENPKNLKIEELEAAQISRALSDVDYGVINGNYALQAKLNVAKDALIKEGSEKSINTFANIIAVKKGNEDLPGVKQLVEVLGSAEMQKFVADKYKGSVVMLENK